jgi:DNA anti-recombination protein RmuC
MQKGFGSFADQAMPPSPSSKPANAAESPPGAQKQLSDFMGKYFDSMNMPSRAQMAGLGKQLRRIEGELRKIEGLLEQLRKPLQALASAASAPKPRTKRVPSGEQK